MPMKEPVEPIVNDGLACPEVGGWAITKYKLISLYDKLFSTGMKDKWGKRVYIDLYAGAGYSRIRGKSNIVLGSPLLALSVPHSFDKYIFCEKDEELLSALKMRAQRIAPSADIAYVHGDCNSRVHDIAKEIPQGSKENTVLGLCFVDPFNLEGMRFNTLKTLSAHYLDFLCLLALYMDANRNYALYIDEQSSKVDDFLGTRSWRQRWPQEQMKGISFPRFLANELSEQMKTIGYIPPPFYTMKEVRSEEKNLPLYHLALFSRSTRAYDFWSEVQKYSTNQTKMFEA